MISESWDIPNAKYASDSYLTVAHWLTSSTRLILPLSPNHLQTLCFILCQMAPRDTDFPLS